VTTKKHNKHPTISRATRGEYGRNEIGVIGAPCDLMLDWVNHVSENLSKYRLAYIDADHQPSPAGVMKKVTDKQTHHHITHTEPLNKYDHLILLDREDLVIVNCNHFVANRQIVFCTEKKRESLKRKMDKLTDVRLVVLHEEVDRPFDFLKPVLKDDTPILKMDNIKDATTIVESLIIAPVVKGLILAGGRSTRMGEDKAAIKYHNINQVDFLQEKFKSNGIEPYVSCREDQRDLYSDNVIQDVFLDMGPFGAILSAFKKFPDAAWIVVACDLPLLTEDHINLLLKNRDQSKIATCFYNPETGWPDPLLTLWEPKSYSRLLEFMSLGYNCPRKVLINSDVNLIQSEDASFLANANNPSEKEEIIKRLRGL